LAQENLKLKTNSEKNEKYPEGHFVGLWTGLGIAIFSGIGIPLSIISDNLAFIGIGPAMGTAIGVAIGQALEEKYQREGKIRPLTEAEKKRKRIAIAAGVSILVFGLLFFLRP
jgi:hypothetical protein